MKDVTIGPEKVYDASVLWIDGVAADVEVSAHEHRHIEYAIVGPVSLVDAIRIELRGSKLCFWVEGSKGPIGALQGGMFVADIVSSAASRTTNATTEERPVKITFKVPRGTPIEMRNVDGATVIRNVAR